MKRLPSALLAALLAAGCASTQVEATWADPQMPARPLRAAKVLVACESYDTVLQRLCQDRLAAELIARGATTVLAPDIPNPTQGRQAADDRWLPAAREAGATAVMSATVTIGDTYVNPGFSIGVGGGGWGSSGGGGVGVSMPVGGGSTTTGHAASGRVTDVATGRLLWTTRASTPPSSDLNAQMTELARAVLGAADKSALF